MRPEWVSDQAVQRFLSHYDQITHKTVLTNLNRFLVWLEKDGRFPFTRPGDLVEFQERVEGKEQYRLLDLLEECVRGCEGTYRGKVVFFSTARACGALKECLRWMG